VVELLLQASGADLTSVEDGVQAVEAFKLGGFDLVLMDVQMPVMDGLAATRAIREHEQALALARTPVVALTANALPEHVKASAEAGADAHLAKPITASTLLPLIAQLLEAGNDGRPLKAASAA
jgi:CheY-like chemotaxis protein